MRNSQSKTTNNKLSTIILKMLQKQKCNLHQSPFLYVNLQNNRFGCERCVQPQKSNYRNLQMMLDNPVLFMKIKSEYEFRQQIPHQNIDNIKTIKHAFNQLINQIQTKILKSCSQIKQTINTIYDEYIEQIRPQITYLQNIEIQYRQHFEQLISDNMVQGTQKQLQSIIKQFQKCNQDPSHAISQKINKIDQQTLKLPSINWQNLSGLYGKILDPLLWQQSMFISYANPSINKSIQQEILFKSLLPQIPNKLTNSQYTILYDESTIRLLSIPQQSISKNDSLDDDSYQKQDNHLSQQTILTQIQAKHDDYYELNQFRILGVSYEILTLYSYAFDRLNKINQYKITGCTEVLSFTDCLILIANNRLIRLWLEDGSMDVLGLCYHKIQYCRTNYSYFVCTAQSGQRYLKSVKHNSISIQCD